MRLEYDLRRRMGICALSIAAIVSGMASSVEAQEASNELTWTWSDGLRFQTKDKKFAFKFGGRIMNDWVFQSGDTALEALVGPMISGTEMRRARLYLQGTIYGSVSFKSQYDFAGGSANVKDMWVKIGKLPGVGALKVGHFKEPFGLEELTSSKYITFMERASITAFSPSRNSGIAIQRTVLEGDRMQYALGLFKDSNGFAMNQTEGNFNGTGRVTYLAIDDKEAQRKLHFGVAGSYRSPNADMVRYRERPENHMSPRFVDTGSFAADSVILLGLEAAYVQGPLSFQAEYMMAQVDAVGSSDPSFAGGYVYGSYYLTGESRHYSKKKGAFSRTKVKSPYGDGENFGAIELAARWSFLDLKDAAVTGGEMQNFTLGVNMHLNNNARLMFNVVHSMLDRGSVDKDADAFLMRVQVDF